MPKYVTEMAAMDRAHRAASQAHAVMFCINQTFDDNDGSFPMNDRILYDANYAVMDLIQDIREALDEMTEENLREHGHLTKSAA